MFVLVKICFAFSLLISTYSEGSELYNYNADVCCDGTLHPLTEDESVYDYDCCGSKAFKFETEDDSSESVTRCCGGQLHENIPISQQCCGTDLYEESTHACYQWGIDGFAAVRLPNIDKGETEVCGKTKDEWQAYNPDEKVCCSGVLNTLEVDSVKRCCGDQYIDTTVAKCCLDYVKNDNNKGYTRKTSVANYNGVDPEDAKCCGGKVIDSSKEECCAGVSVTLPDGFSSYSYNFDDDEYLDFTDGYADYDGSVDPYSSCCGTKLITNEMQQCVGNGLIEEKTDRNQMYCGGEWHLISGEEPLLVYCLRDQVKKLKFYEGMCSVNGENVIYKPKERQVCGVNKIINATKDDEDNDRFFVCTQPKDGLYSTDVYPDMYYVPASYNGDGDEDDEDDEDE